MRVMNPHSSSRTGVPATRFFLAHDVHVSRRVAISECLIYFGEENTHIHNYWRIRIIAVQLHMKYPWRRSLKSGSTLSLGKGRGEGGRHDILRQKDMDRGIGSCYFIYLTFYFLNITQLNLAIQSGRRDVLFIYYFIYFSKRGDGQRGG